MRKKTSLGIEAYLIGEGTPKIEGQGQEGQIGVDITQRTRMVQLSQDGIAIQADTAVNLSGNAGVVMVLPSDAIFSRFISLPPCRNQRRVNETLLYEARQQVPFKLDEVLLKFDILPSRGSDDEIEVGIFAVKKVVADRYRSLVRTPNDPKFVTIVDALNPLVQFPQRDHDLLVYQSKGQGTFLAIRGSDGNYFVRSLPIGDVSVDGLVSKNADRPKFNLYVAKRVLHKDLMAEIQRSIGYYKNLRDGVKFSAVYVVGEDTRLLTLEQTQQLLAKNLGEVGKVSLQYPSHRALAGVQIPHGLEVAFGAALYGLNGSGSYFTTPPKESKTAR